MQNPIPSSDLNSHWLAYWPRVKDAILQAVQNVETPAAKSLEEVLKQTIDGTAGDVSMEEPSAYDLSATFIDNLWAPAGTH